MHNKNIFHFLFVSLVYIAVYILTIIIPFSPLIIILVLLNYNKKLALRVSIIALVAILNNQFVISNLSVSLYGLGKLHIYQAGILFYLIIVLLITIFSRFKLINTLKLFGCYVVVFFLLYYSNIIKSILFSFNVFGGFFMFFLLLSCLINYRKKDLKVYYDQLTFDFFYLIFFILIASILISLIDLSTNFYLLKYQATAVSNFRGSNENILFVNGFPKIYVTGFGNYDFILRYTPLVNDPVRAGYWYVCFIMFILFIIRKITIKLFLLPILLVLLVLTWSKGAIIFIVLIGVYYFLFKKKMQNTAYLFFIGTLSLMIYLSGILKTSAAIHVLGLKIPFEQSFGLRYLFGNGLHKAGNMGRLEGEHWMESVSRGAESLVGTYFYAFGLIGFLLYSRLHIIYIKKFNSNGFFVVSSILISSFFISFLQEGQYNVFQIFPFLLFSFFVIFKNEF
ncbi:hypothetical protein [Cellulophaga lytica]|uniref:O-antigen polymerase n=1 Tax=Cellulophaga lytica (strain ATCC 23178 / DSM 7489 / JCM 8516 / NBRC 14961 / NCIMB 1423 / VKM B-1433 / Cy l20) TaxID=867900 RepID=F0RHE5_CELLC|nr:hypothetical protein [Cellulophaga lytica]ADY29185.1 hypothetical protein Celly_1359 [Cellulophaga lytica DSM 7489]WQG76641.1 hypothetical protein SR888_13190 [Cellulophaga lytica]